MGRACGRGYRSARGDAAVGARGRQILRRLVQQADRDHAQQDRAADKRRPSQARSAPAGEQAAAPNLAARQRVSLGKAQSQVERALQRAEQERFAQRLAQRDPTLWQPASRGVGPTPAGGVASTTTEITDRLGWLTVADQMTGVIPQLERLRDDVRAAGFTHCVLLGMGGSSLAPAVLRAALGVAQGQPDLIVLDTTDPATIQTLTQSLPLTHTLFLVASKSGTTLETISQFKYFYERVRQFAGRPRGRPVHRHHRPGNQAGSGRRRIPVPRRLPQSARHRRPLLGALLFRAGTGGDPGDRPAHAARPRRDDGARLRPECPRDARIRG